MWRSAAWLGWGPLPADLIRERTPTGSNMSSTILVASGKLLAIFEKDQSENRCASTVWQLREHR
jgi:hypothetical protein